MLHADHVLCYYKICCMAHTEYVLCYISIIIIVIIIVIIFIETRLQDKIGKNNKIQMAWLTRFLEVW